ncbi:acyl-CoA thioester hydrolase/BAAT C-terminal domain-containing protein [Halogranum rubrum]|uniref:Uncharacterized protein n=1 Tax=Halogranum salarium B-1 TaxID=1210908 RepID=J3ET93_9EURY|nr:hypothetical protein HSB1_42650 [Halogranum salarium B-1]
MWTNIENGLKRAKSRCCRTLSNRLRQPSGETMSLDFAPTRRRFIQSVGAIGSVALAGCSSEEATPAIEVPSTALRDDSVSITMTGLEAYSEITLEARAHDRSGAEWISTATFESGADGTVTVGKQRPLNGRYYESADSMGPLWSMRPVEADPTEPLAPGVRFFPPESAYEVTLTVRVGDQSLTETTTRRRLYDPNIEHVEITTEDVVGAAFFPPGDEPAPGVIHLHGAGGQPHRGLARLLASYGFATLALQYFGDPEPLPATLREVPIEYIEEAIAWLSTQDRVAEQQIGLFGFSRGGTLALLAATHIDHVGAVVGWVPSGVVYEGLDLNRTPAGTSAWTVGGEPVPYLELAEPSLGPPPNPGLPYFEPPLEDTSSERLEAATIPIETADAPIYLVSATDDQRWPSTRLSERVIDRLDDSEHPNMYRHDVYKDAGHFLFPPYLPTAGTMRSTYNVYGGSPAANAHANSDAWARTRSFLANSLRRS